MFFPSFSSIWRKSLNFFAFGNALNARIRRNLARFHLRPPIGTAELVLEQLAPVEPMLDVVAVDDEPRRIPFAARVHHAGRRRVQTVRGTRRREPRFAVRVLRIVEHLHFRCVPIDLVAVFARAIENAAVAAGLDFPVDRQLEVPELLVGDDVPPRSDTRESAIPHRPTVGNVLLPIIPPTRRRLSIEQRPPLAAACTTAHQHYRRGESRPEVCHVHAGSPASSRSRTCTARRPRSLRVITRIASSPAMVPMISLQPAPSSASASGCALPVVVFSTSAQPTPSAETSMLGNSCSRCGRTPPPPP